MKHVVIVVLILIAMLLTGCGGTIMVAGKRFGALPVDARAFVRPGAVKLYASADAAWSALETGYRYEPDEWYISDKHGQTIPGGNDTWLYPSEVQYLIDHYPEHGMDCEDGAAWLASALRKQGLDAWLCVGTVTIDGIQYGHAWTMVLDKGKWITYETTVNATSEGLPSIYSMAWRTDGQTTFRNLMAGSPLNLEPLPADALSTLRGLLS